MNGWITGFGITKPKSKVSAQLFTSRLCGIIESESEVTQSCPTLCDIMDCSLAGSSIQGIFQAKTLEWVLIPIKLF